MKAVAWYIIFIIAIIALTIFGLGIVLYHFISIGPREADRISCQMKYWNYCFRWLKDKKEPGDWDKIAPQEGCEKFGIEKPKENDCKKLFPL